MVGLLVNYYVSNSYHSFQAILMRLVSRGHYEEKMCKEYIVCEAQPRGSRFMPLFRNSYTKCKSNNEKVCDFLFVCFDDI